jgi:cytidyltransferase-like protein
VKPADIWGDIKLRGTFACAGYLARSFDLINVSDLDLISQARQLCSRLVIGVHSDELVRQLTGRAPVVPLSERLALVANVRGVDEVVVHEAGSSPADPDTILFVDGDLPSGGPTNTVRLDSIRFTESAALRLALEPVGEAVA